MNRADWNEGKDKPPPSPLKLIVPVNSDMILDLEFAALRLTQLKGFVHLSTLEITEDELNERLEERTGAYSDQFHAWLTRRLGSKTYDILQPYFMAMLDESNDVQDGREIEAEPEAYIREAVRRYNEK